MSSQTRLSRKDIMKDKKDKTFKLTVALSKEFGHDTEYDMVIDKPLGIIRVKRSEYEAMCKAYKQERDTARICNKPDMASYDAERLRCCSATGNSHIVPGLIKLEIIEG
jgi:hypothetical protein